MTARGELRVDLGLAAVGSTREPVTSRGAPILTCSFSIALAGGAITRTRSPVAAGLSSIVSSLFQGVTHLPPGRIGRRQRHLDVDQCLLELRRAVLSPGGAMHTGVSRRARCLVRPETIANVPLAFACELRSLLRQGIAIMRCHISLAASGVPVISRLVALDAPLVSVFSGSAFGHHLTVRAGRPAGT